MSIAEDLLLESLSLVLHCNEPISRNARLDILRNPYSGCNLELDVFLPRLQLGIEVQGPHHYRDEKQIFRDVIKRQLCTEANIHLLEISIFEIRPLYVRAKLLDYSRSYNKHVNIQPHNALKWSALDRKITQYRKQILSIFGNSEDYTPPQARLQREQHLKQNYQLSKCLYMIAKVEDKSIRVKPLKWSNSNKITVKTLGSHISSAFKINRSSIVEFC